MTGLTVPPRLSVSNSSFTTTTRSIDDPKVAALSTTSSYTLTTSESRSSMIEITAAVRRNGEKMFLVIGDNVAWGAALGGSVQSGREASGKVAVDAGTDVGLKGLGRVLVGGGEGEDSNMQNPERENTGGSDSGVVVKQQRSVQEDEGRKGKLLGEGIPGRGILKREQTEKEKGESERESDWRTSSKTRTEYKQEYFTQDDNGLNPYIQLNVRLVPFMRV
ncbi:hypothetical protein EV426DRAFT_711740 [Tirmania nivea]|nr:hypothetical protein EV426DRAFT_711740 [Tirmania nivea]